MAGRDACLLRAVEARAVMSFHLVTAPSHQEAGRMPGTVDVIVNGVDPAGAAGPWSQTRMSCASSGSSPWAPNIDGAEWLVHDVLPLLPAHMRIELVGRKPHRRVEKLAGPRVTVTGEVPDTLPYLSRQRRARAAARPGGTRLKILEGLLAERPVVATPAAADGLEDLEGEGLVLAADPASFAARVVELRGIRTAAQRLGRAGRNAVVERYSWEASCTRLLELYEERLGLA